MDDPCPPGAHRRLAAELAEMALDQMGAAEGGIGCVADALAMALAMVCLSSGKSVDIEHAMLAFRRSYLEEAAHHTPKGPQLKLVPNREPERGE